LLIKKELLKPNLDDKTFRQLVEDSIKYIPLYASEWTDHNLSDPGITLLELFSWISETYLYRINYISDRHRLKYLKLLGAYPQSIKPAEVDLTFESEQPKILTKGHQISTTVSGKEICFELKEDIIISPIKLNKLIVDELTDGINDRTIINEQADQFFAAFGLNVQKDCALYLGFNKPANSISFMCYLYEKDLIPPGSHGNEPEYKFNNSILQWEYLTASGWKVIKPLKDDTNNFQKTGRIDFINLNDWSETEYFISKDFCCWLRCIVVDSEFEYPPRIEHIRLNTCTAIQAKQLVIMKTGSAMDCLTRNFI